MPKKVLIEEPVEDRIVLVRQQKVLLDEDLAALYGVTVKQLNQQIKRNADRFPSDFVFRLSFQEYSRLRSQIVTAKKSRGGRRNTPLAFAEHGAIMAATILNSPRAIQMSVFVVRAFVRLREMLATNKEFAEKIHELEKRLDRHDQSIQQIIAAIKVLMHPPSRPLKQIGFHPEAEQKPRALKARTM